MTANINKQPKYTTVITIDIIPWELKKFWIIKRFLFKVARTVSSRFSWPFSKLSNSPIFALCWKN